MYEKLKKRWDHIRQERVNISQMRAKRLLHLVPIFQKYAVHQVYLFGSVATNTCHVSSDVDLYIEGLDNRFYWEILRDLENACSYNIDLYTQADDQQFTRKIKQRGVKIYESKY